MTPDLAPHSFRPGRHDAVGVIGLGRVGSALARALAAADVPLAGLATRDEAGAAELARETGVRLRPADQVLTRATVSVLAVPDDHIGGLALELARAARARAGNSAGAGRAVAHCSGALDAAPLAPLRRLGWQVGAWHPLQAVPTRATPLAPGITWAITADPPLDAVLSTLTGLLGGRSAWVSAQDKPRYHAAAALASNYTVTLLAHAADVLAGMGWGEPLPALLALLRSTLDGVEAAGVPQGLTGPLARGDLGTVRAHLSALADRAEVDTLYRGCGLATLPLLRRRGMPEEVVEALRALLSGPTPGGGAGQP